jgi:hypothetical protein
MKKQSDLDDELRPEYDLGVLLKDASRGKYAQQYAEGTNLVLLEPDVAEAFTTPEAVNEALRLVLHLSQIPSQHGKNIAAT